MLFPRIFFPPPCNFPSGEMHTVPNRLVWAGLGRPHNQTAQYFSRRMGYLGPFSPIDRPDHVRSANFFLTYWCFFACIYKNDGHSRFWRRQCRLHLEPSIIGGGSSCNCSICQVLLYPWTCPESFRHHPSHGNHPEKQGIISRRSEEKNHFVISCQRKKAIALGSPRK